MAKRITTLLLVFMLICTTAISVGASDDQLPNEGGGFFWGGWFPQEPDEDGEYIELPDNMAERHFSFIIKKGTSFDYIFDHILFPDINVKVHNILEPYDECDIGLEIMWDLTGVDFEQPGDYRITGKIINAYDNVTLAAMEVTADVEIVLYYKPELEHAYYDREGTIYGMEGTLVVYFGWWHPNENQKVTIWLTENDGDTWTNISETNRLSYDNSDSRRFYVSGIEADSEYGFYIEVEGDGDIGGVSNVFIIEINSEGDVANLENSGGSRNGNNRPPIGLIPAPEENSSNGQNSGGTSPGGSSGTDQRPTADHHATPNTVTSGRTELSVKQIQLEAKFNIRYLPFTADGIKAEISTPFLVKRNETAAVELKKLSGTKFSVGIELGGKKVQSLPQAYTCYFPYEPSGVSDKLVVTGSDGNIIPASFYDSKNKRMVLTTVKTGTFTIKTKTSRTFPDAKNHWANSAISFLSARSIIGGLPDGSFRPDQQVSGSEWFTMLARLNGTTVQSAKQGPKWYTPYTDWAVSRGIANNRTNFEARLSREQACQYLYKYAKAMGLQAIDVTASKESLSKVNNNTAVAVFYQLGIVQGMGDGKFHPNETLTRGQCAEIIKNFIKICYR